MNYQLIFLVFRRQHLWRNNSNYLQFQSKIITPFLWSKCSMSTTTRTKMMFNHQTRITNSFGLTNRFLYPRNPIHHTMIMWRSYRPIDQEKNRSTAMLLTALVVIVLGLSYAAVPLYRIYCQKTGTGLQAVAKVDEINEKVANMKKITDRKIRVKFEAEKSSRLAWNFQPSQPSVVCSPGETILAFYTAKNELDRPVNGIATYTILPYEAGKYFNKIQCFCFEEQQLNANEEVDLPVFFFIDPEFIRDPYLFDINEIILSYNFFETKEGFKLPKPPGFRAHYPAAEQQQVTTTN
ncbi:Cytochrome c oxidase assembly protein cox11, mitochondrial [Dermatophagoides pteronyssinus]|uniref:Cytochrome c oxidase assembly protein cox11, mitochondrial n=1 Tax=Dermatophagoides pteronyssinus TaxID=6956 RepID=A0ABQ8IQW3_DERPT|nr:Cytochrome c oxidase assembly protein cox11, mitochondrial [Dermatophagoides pteronyssinus]